MPRRSGPEEFFEVFREMQEGKKSREPGGTERPKAPEPSAPEHPAVLSDATEEAPAPPTEAGLQGTVTVGYFTVGAAFVIVALLCLATYLLGRHHGWEAHGAALERARREAGASPATHSATTPGVTGPEIVDGTIFTLLTLGRGEQDAESVATEVEYLNSYGPFLALQIEAYSWRDRSGKYRVCARGLRSMDEATRNRVRDQVRRLTSRHGKREYRDSDFLAP